MMDIKNDPKAKALYDKLTNEEKARIDGGLKDPRFMHLEAIKANYVMLGASMTVAISATMAICLGHDVTHFKSLDMFMEYLDKSLKEEELEALAITLLIIVEAAGV